MDLGPFAARRCGVIAAVVTISACSGPGETEPPPSLVPRALCTPVVDDGAPVDFFADILPIIGDSCVRCHGGVRELGTPHLNLQTRDRAEFVLGHSGDACSSELYRRVSVADPGLRMPLEAQPISPEKVQQVGNWVLRGAPWPRHWSFAPLAEIEPSTISVQNESWIKTPVDRFVMQRLERAQITPSPEADRTTLLRRVSLDLIGLPPSIEEVDAFVADTSASAFEKVVDRLLASPSFGETWGRHWLDQARYADSDGWERDGPRPDAWRWRDWVIDAVNHDQPFDQFTVEQIAGDLLPKATPTQVLATGFHRQTLINKEFGVDPEEDRNKRVVDRVATLGTVWLGLSLGCAQCHSHPYDPIAQKEFYRLFAFFNNANEATITVPATASYAEGPADVVAQDTTRPTYLLVRGDFLNPDKNEALDPGTPSILHDFKPRGATADRLDLAQWIVDRSNPLTPRVAVNAIWYHLFGQGIVASLDDFGTRARLPSHPELLDWLARDFVEHGWQRKRVIKQIVMSATYRQSAAPRPDVAVTHADNALLYRQNRLRVAAETVTDTCLAASGLLAPHVGGPAVYPPIPPELLNIGVYGLDWPTSLGDDRHRRAMYTFYKRTLPYPNLQVFDQPAAYASETGRGRSNTPLQALATMHNTVFVDAARALARRVQAETPSDRRAQMVRAFRLALTRSPNDAELAELEALYQDSLKSYGADENAAAALVADGAPPGVSLASAAAWVVTAQVVLNLDETITRE